jgi:hypothetical protein
MHVVAYTCIVYSGPHSESSGIGASLANHHREQQHNDEVTLSAVTLDQLQQHTAANANSTPQHSGIHFKN